MIKITQEQYARQNDSSAINKAGKYLLFKLILLSGLLILLFTILHLPPVLTSGIIFLLWIYFIPTIVAYKRAHHNKLAIHWLNVFTAWSFIGWVIALVWACTDNLNRE